MLQGYHHDRLNPCYLSCVLFSNLKAIITMNFFLYCLPLAVGAFAQQEQVPLEAAITYTNPETIPKLGFGTWNLDKSNATEAVSWAIQTGYRHIDCAAIYGNEKEVGRGIADGLLKTGLRRQDLWITSKLWNDHHGRNAVQSAIEKTLQDLGVGYLDLYHMHWPVSSGVFGGNTIEYRETWGAMELMVVHGKTTHIGVSNFSPYQLEHLLNHTSTKPAVHQFETHAYLQQPDFLAWHEKHGIHVTAYSPLGGTNPTYDAGDLTPLLKNDVIAKVARKRSCTPAQVALAWGLSRGTSVIPKAQRQDHIVENFNATLCALTAKDLHKIEKLGKEHHRYNNPSKSWKLELYEGLEDSTGKHKKHS
nr:putative oxidoreductase c26f1.07 [Quercus suber]